MARKTHKPHKGLQKRVKVTGTGKVKRHRAGKSHRMYSWSAKRIRRGRSAEICPACDAKVIKVLLGIG
ncbi:MAG: 50S ribosomal protein L35 [Planctomycetota bacterium]